MNDDNHRYENLARQMLLGRLPDPAFAPAPDEMAARLARHAARLIDENSFLRHLAGRSGDPLAMRHEMSRLALPEALAALLGGVEDQRPELFRHLLHVALISHYLALRRELPSRDIHAVLLAALCHDLGETCTDPALLQPEHRVGDDERRYIYVHPISGYLIARDIAELDSAIATAVLQHQERMDGSGYPHGLRADRIGAFARIVGIADVCAAILTRFGNHERLGALMRLNRQKFDISLLALLNEALGQTPPPPAPAAPGASGARLAAAAGIVAQWSEFRPALAQRSDGRPIPELAFLIERMATLRHMLLEFGFDPASQHLLSELLSDPQVAGELGAALDEVHWQFRDLEREMARRREVVEPLLDADGKRLLNEWMELLRAYLSMADAQD